MTPRLYYLARANRGLPRGAFPARWAAHGALGMALPRWRNVAQYLQCDRIAGASWDGVAVVAFRSEEARLAHVADPDGRVTKADEMLCFDRPISETACLADGADAPPVAEGGLRLFRFLGAESEAWSPTQRRRVREVDPGAIGIRLPLRPGAAMGFRWIEEVATRDPVAVAEALNPGKAPLLWVAARVRVLWPAPLPQA